MDFNSNIVISVVEIGEVNKAAFRVQRLAKSCVLWYKSIKKYLRYLSSQVIYLQLTNEPSMILKKLILAMMRYWIYLKTNFLNHLNKALDFQ